MATTNAANAAHTQTGTAACSGIAAGPGNHGQRGGQRGPADSL